MIEFEYELVRDEGDEVRTMLYRVRESSNGEKRMY